MPRAVSRYETAQFGGIKDRPGRPIGNRTVTGGQESYLERAIGIEPTALCLEARRR